MAIIEKHFTAVVGKENTKEVIDWMYKNATEYFNTFESDLAPDDYSTMIFRKGNAYIKFVIYPNNMALSSLEVKLANGVSKSIGFHNMLNSNATHFISRAVKTNSGIVLSFSTLSDTSTFKDILVISKTNTDNTGILWMTDLNQDYYLVSLANSIDFSTSYRLATNTRIFTKTITSFCNIPCSGNTTDYFPNIFITPFYEHTYGEIIDNNGCKYKYFGLPGYQTILLKD